MPGLNSDPKKTKTVDALEITDDRPVQQGYDGTKEQENEGIYEVDQWSQDTGCVTQPSITVQGFKTNAKLRLLATQ